MVSNTENMEQDGNGSQLFEPYMELGRIVDSNAFILKPPTQDDAVHSIIVSIGKAYRIYNTEHIKVTFTSRQLPSRVRSLAYVDGWVFAASGFNIYGTKQGYEPITFQGHTAKVESILGFGKYLISVSRDNTINFWSTEPPELYHSIKDLHNFDISVIMHPDTYVNKVLVASKTGAMKLLNIMTQKVIYSFKGFGSPILCVEQSPAIDVVGIGCQNGNIYIHNLKFDQTVVAFNQVTAVTSLSFRSDSHPMLVTGGADGTLTVWNLEKKKLSMVLKGAHGYGGGAVTPYSAVTGLKFLAGEPLLISTGADNSIKTWVFDKDNTEPHLLRFKSGHYRTITSMKFYPTLDQQRYTIVTASQDRDLRIFAASAANHNLLFSQGERLYKQSKQNEVSLEVLKRNVITDFDFNNLYEKDWDNIITCHEGENTAQTWRYLKNKIGAHKFVSTDPDFRAPPIKAVCVSSCGNFGLLGNVHGWIDRYNMQSGLHRGSYIDDTIGRAHTGSIQGLVTDALNRTLISAGLDGYLKFWDFASQKVQHSVNIGSAITKILLYKENSLLAVVSDDLVIRVYDVTTQTMVRKFTGHTNQITDIVFNHDGRWLVSASSDTTVRTWDMVAGRLIDWFRVSEPVIALAFHPQGKFLVTSHAGECCLFLWVNRAFYGRPLLRTLSAEAPLQSLPTSSGADEDQLSKMFEIPETREFVPLDASLLTLSDQPRQKFEIVTNIDVIKERNKPEKAPEKPASAPFFLPTLPGLVPQFAPSDAKGESFFASDFGGSSSKKAKGENGEPMDAEPAPKLAAEGSKIMSLDTMDFKSEFERKLKRGNANKDYSEAFAHLKKLSPSGIDFEIQGLSLQNDYEELKWFMEMLTTRLQAHDDYDMCQALMSVFLKHHSQVLMENAELLPGLSELREQQHLSWLRIQREFHSSLCLIKYFSGIQM